jgi:hypothetical protein
VPAPQVFGVIPESVWPGPRRRGVTGAHRAACLHGKRRNALISALHSEWSLPIPNGCGNPHRQPSAVKPPCEDTRVASPPFSLTIQAPRQRGLDCPRHYRPRTRPESLSTSGRGTVAVGQRPVRSFVLPSCVLAFTPPNPRSEPRKARRKPQHKCPVPPGQGNGPPLPCRGVRSVRSAASGEPARFLLARRSQSAAFQSPGNQPGTGEPPRQLHPFPD